MTWWRWLLIAAGMSFATYAAFVVWLAVAGRRHDARALAGFIPDCVVLFRRLLGDDRVPRRSKLLLAVLIGYLAMPFDLVPDFIPVAGQLDDAIAVALVLRAVVRAGGPELLRQHWPGPTTSLNVLMRLSYGSAAVTPQLTQQPLLPPAPATRCSEATANPPAYVGRSRGVWLTGRRGRGRDGRAAGPRS